MKCLHVNRRNQLQRTKTGGKTEYFLPWGANFEHEYAKRCNQKLQFSSPQFHNFHQRVVEGHYASQFRVKHSHIRWYSRDFTSGRKVIKLQRCFISDIKKSETQPSKALTCLVAWRETTWSRFSQRCFVLPGDWCCFQILLKKKKKKNLRFECSWAHSLAQQRWQY